jgi:PhnB protein
MAANIAEGHQQVMPYIIVQGALKFKNFLELVFDGKEKEMHMDGERVMHGQVTIGESVIMFSDATDSFSTMNCALFIYVEDTDATHKKAIEAGAASVMEPSDQEYGRASGVKDPWGNTWWITAF